MKNTLEFNVRNSILVLSETMPVFSTLSPFLATLMKREKWGWQICCGFRLERPVDGPHIGLWEVKFLFSMNPVLEYHHKIYVETEEKDLFLALGVD